MKDTTITVGEIRDLCDFCERWDELNRLVSPERMKASGLPPETREVIEWMRILAEKHCVLNA